RHGSIRSPIWVKGGVTFAPKPRDYSFKITRKMRRLALKSALTSKAAGKEILVLDSLELSQPKTKEMVKVLKNLEVQGKALVVLPERNETLSRAAGNLQEVKLASVNTLNVLDILNYDKFIITKDAVLKVEEVYA
ncbi:MAG: 50S ribosomal protein L4, partial [Clostridiales bacterium]|nr:50S ribosomal protein L4 [Clostridiales bacterium]